MHSQSIVGSLLLAGLASAAPTSGGGEPKKTSNYAGAMTYGTNIVEVNADIIIPVVTPGVPYYQTVPYQSNGWIGLSAWGKKGLIQTGITCTSSSDDSGVDTTCTPWAEWAPYGPKFYNSTNFRAGDVVRANVVAHSTIEGTCTLTNTRTGEVLTRTYTNMTAYPLTLSDVEWITESQLQQTELGATGVRGASYTPWRWENATYSTIDGTTKTYTLSTPNDHTVYDVLAGVKIAEGIYNGPGSIQVNNTTPSNYTLRGPCTDDC